MHEQEAKKEIELLRAEIVKRNYEYFVLDKSDISEAVRDDLKKRLIELETQFPSLITKDSPSQRVGSVLSGKFASRRHLTPKKSLQDAFSLQEVEAWRARAAKALPQKSWSFVCELKIDGLNITLHYEKGLLKRALTRGDGTNGEDVTHTVRTIESIPLRLDEALDLEIGGEVFIPKSEFEAINQRQIERGADTFANPRNAAAGTVRQLDPKIAAERCLDAFFYSIHENSLEEKPKSQIEVLETLKKLGFRTNHKSKHCLDLKSVEDFCLEFQEKREQLPYEIDGVVIKINEFEIQDLLGFTAKFPRFALAYKFPAMQAVSRIEDILISVGRTGALTPVAKLTATLLAGSTISRATLHNEDEIRRKDIKIGDHVVIQKAGDIIPEVVSVLINLRDGTQRDFHFPETCPVCGAKVAKEEKEAAYRCTNPSCQAMEIQNLMHFVGKAALDIDGMGPKVIEQLVQAGLIVDAADIFTLADDDLRQLPLFKEKRSTNLIEAIKKAKTPQLGKFIFALGIRFIGEKIADDLAEFLYSTYLHDLEEVAPFELLEKIKNLSFIELSNVEGFGEKVCQSFLHWLSEPKTANLMQKFQNSGVKIQLQKNKNFDSKLKGKNFVFTGTLNLNRNQAKEMAKNLGAKVQSAISANTDFLVCGENAGSKLQKAKALGVKVLNEQDFLELVS